MSINKFAILNHQAYLLKKNYDFLNYRIHNNVLVCTGWISQPDCEDYKIKIEYVGGHEPKSTIMQPLIEPCRDIHMYHDHSLCLSYPPDLVWTVKTPMCQCTIPWISKWILYYEMYKINGNIWEGPESPTHFKESDRNINVDVPTMSKRKFI